MARWDTSSALLLEAAFCSGAAAAPAASTAAPGPDTPPRPELAAVELASAAGAVLPGGGVFRPQAYGAKADGKHNDTAAVLAAVAACRASASKGGGCSLLFSGGSFLTGPFTLSSHSVVTVAAGATLLAAPMEQWKAAGWSASALLTGEGLTNITLMGDGTIDGNGAAWWAVTKDDMHYRPGLLVLSGTNGLVIEDVLLQNSPNHNIELADSIHVRVRRLRVSAPHHSPNTDGINFAGGHDQSIVDSHISNGDDCVSIVCAGARVPAPPGAGGGTIPYGGNVIVRNVTCDGGHGISIGSIRHGYVSNVTVEGVYFNGSDNGARIKTYPNHSGLITDITYRNIVMNNVVNPIQINGAYCPKSQKPYPCPPGAVAVKIENIVFEDITGSGAIGRVGNFACSPLSPCRNITMRNVDLKAVSHLLGKAKFDCSNAHGPAAVGVVPTSCLKPVRSGLPAPTSKRTDEDEPVQITDLKITDIVKARDRGGGNSTADTTNWAPSIVVTKSNAVLVFTLAQWITPDKNNPPHFLHIRCDAILSRSTDGGESFGENQDVGAGGIQALYSPTTDTTYAFGLSVVGHGSESNASGAALTMATSKRDGKSWSEPVVLADPFVLPGNGTTIEGGLGHGVELQHGPHRGRFVLPYTEGSTTKNRYAAHALAVYSDEKGAKGSWKAGALLPDYSGEADLTELANGSVLITFRSEGERMPKNEAAKVRGFARSDDGGSSWAEVWYANVRDPAMLDEPSMQGIDRSEKTGAVYFGHPGAANGDRANYTIHRSTDSGATFKFVGVITNNGSGYSDVRVLPHDGKGDRLGVAFQRTINEPGVEGGGYDMAFATMTIKSDDIVDDVSTAAASLFWDRSSRRQP